MNGKGIRYTGRFKLERETHWEVCVRIDASSSQYSQVTGNVRDSAMILGVLIASKLDTAIELNYSDGQLYGVFSFKSLSIPTINFHI